MEYDAVFYMTDINFLCLSPETLEVISIYMYIYVLFVFSDWTDEQLPPTNILRLIYQGRFLHGNVTLAGEIS